MTAEEQEKIKKSVKEGKRHQIHVYKTTSKGYSTLKFNDDLLGHTF
jgi:fructose-1,6-bisphosphatase